MTGDPVATGPRTTGPRTASTQARGATVLIGGQIGASLLVLVAGIVLARALGPAGKGYYDVVLNSATLVTTFSGLSLASGVGFYAAREGMDARALLRVGGLGALAVAVVLLAVLMAGGGARRALAWLLPSGAGGLAPVLLMAALVVCLHLLQLGQALAKGLGHFADFSLSELLLRSGTLGGAVVLALAGVRAPGAYLGVTLAGLAAAVLLLFGRELARGGARPTLPLRPLVRYSLPLFLGNAVQFLNYRLDVYLVNAWLGLRAVGTYTVAVWLAQTLWLLPNAVAALVLRAAASAPTPDDAWAQACRINRLCAAAALLGALALGGGAALGLHVVFGAGFAGSVAPLLLLLPGSVLFSTTIILSAFLNGVHRQHYTTFVACGSLAVTIAADVALIPRLGVAGAALASTLSYAASTVATVWLARREAPAGRLAALLVPTAEDVAMLRSLAAGVAARLGLVSPRPSNHA